MYFFYIEAKVRVWQKWEFGKSRTCNIQEVDDPGGLSSGLALPFTKYQCIFYTREASSIVLIKTCIFRHMLRKQKIKEKSHSCGCARPSCIFKAAYYHHSHRWCHSSRLPPRSHCVHTHIARSSTTSYYLLYLSHVLPPFQNIRCFRFVKQMYLDIFYCVYLSKPTH
jgi:hypothetical protein